jgi:DNA-binding ferritin-like protein
MPIRRMASPSTTWTVYLFSDSGEVLFEKEFLARSHRDAERAGLKLVKPHINKHDDADDWVVEETPAKRAAMDPSEELAIRFLLAEDEAEQRAKRTQKKLRDARTVKAAAPPRHIKEYVDDQNMEYAVYPMAGGKWGLRVYDRDARETVTVHIYTQKDKALAMFDQTIRKVQRQTRSGGSRQARPTHWRDKYEPGKVYKDKNGRKFYMKPSGVRVDDPKDVKRQQWENRKKGIGKFFTGLRSAKSNAKVVEVPNTFHAVQVLPPKAKRTEFPFEGYIDFQGLKIDVENVKGGTRSGKGPEGEWSTFMHAHYGEIRGTEGTDGDKLDVYVGDNHDSSIVVVIHQHNPWDGKYDEDKVVIGCESVEEAIGLYKKQYDRPGFYREGEHTAMPIGAFWRWVNDKKNKGKRVTATRKLVARLCKKADTDRSTDPTVVEYAVQYLFKRKSPSVAARMTAAKLNGQVNLLLGPGVSLVDPKKLEQVLWDRLVATAVENTKKIRPGMESIALGWVVDKFKLKGARDQKKLLQLMEKALGRPLDNSARTGGDLREKQAAQKNPFVYDSFQQGKYFQIALNTPRGTRWWTGRGFKNLASIRGNPETFSSYAVAERKIKTELLDYIEEWVDPDLISGWGKRPKQAMWKRGYTEDQPGALNAAKGVFSRLLALIRAISWNHLTSHWQISGDASYGDHQLFERLYSTASREVDPLAEKLVGAFGSASVDAMEQAKLMAFTLDNWSHVGCPFERGLLAERVLQAALKDSLKAMEDIGQLSIGMDDFLRTMANDHETHIYLLQQRQGGVRMASAQASAKTKARHARNAVVARTVLRLGPGVSR